jgi:hypothetical protein
MMAKARPSTGATEMALDRLIGRNVRAGTENVGRIEEIRAEWRGRELVVTECVLGAAGLVERLGGGAALLFGGAPSGYVARWDQIDFRDPERPLLTCDVSELRRLKAD